MYDNTLENSYFLSEDDYAFLMILMRIEEANTTWKEYVNSL